MFTQSFESLTPVVLYYRHQTKIKIKSSRSCHAFLQSKENFMSFPYKVSYTDVPVAPTTKFAFLIWLILEE